jgi:hypothetical protein
MILPHQSEFLFISACNCHSDGLLLQWLGKKSFLDDLASLNPDLYRDRLALPTLWLVEPYIPSSLTYIVCILHKNNAYATIGIHGLYLSLPFTVFSTGTPASSSLDQFSSLKDCHQPSPQLLRPTSKTC